jgi:hypothetical protein
MRLLPILLALLAALGESRLAEGESMAAIGHQEATQSGEFMGIAPTGKCVGATWTSGTCRAARLSTTG